MKWLEGLKKHILLIILTFICLNSCAGTAKMGKATAPDKTFLKIDNENIYLNNEIVEKVSKIRTLESEPILRYGSSFDSILSKHLPDSLKEIDMHIEDSTPFDIVYKMIGICTENDLTVANVISNSQGAVNVNVSKRADNSANSENKLMLTALVTDSAMTIGAKGGFIPSVFYKKTNGEYIAYKSEYMNKPRNGWFNPELTEVLRDSKGNIIETGITDVDTCFAFSLKNNQVRQITDEEKAAFTQKGISPYLLMNSNMQMIYERFTDVTDRGELVIAAYDNVPFCTVIPLVQGAKKIGYDTFWFAGLRM